MLQGRLRKLALERDFSFSIPAPRKLREVMKMSVVEKENPDVI